MSSDLQHTDRRFSDTGDNSEAGVKERGKQVASQATEAARTVTAEAGQQAKAVASQARQEFQRVVDQARTEFDDKARQEGQRAAQGLRSISRQVDALASGRPEEAGSLANYLYEAEDRLNSVAQRIETGGPQAILDDVTRFARRRPGMFLALAAGTGFLVGRLARSGAAARQEQQQWDGLELPAPTTTAPVVTTAPAWDAPIEPGFTP